MKTYTFLLCAIGICFLSSGCDNDSNTDAFQNSCAVDTLTLAVTDTLGVLVGDSSLMFGSISGVSFDRQGNITVLDALKAQLSVFSPDLQLVNVIGRKGSGPGEYLHPRFFTILTDGRYVVSDWGSSTITFLDSSYCFISSTDAFFPMAPAYIAPGICGNYVAGGMSLHNTDNEIGYEGNTFVGLWADGCDPVIEYVSYPLEITVSSHNGSNEVDVDQVDTVFDTDPWGNVYVAVRSDSTYQIDRYTPEGVLDLTIEQEWNRIAKTEEELQQTVIHESHSRGDEGTTSASRDELLDTYPWHNAISVLKTDSSGNLWVGQGYTQVPTFNVYNPQGELIKVITIPDLTGVRGLDWNFREGFVAYDYAPEDYPKVYFMQLQE